MKIRTTAIVSSLLLAALSGCDSQSTAESPSSGTTLRGVVAGRDLLPDARITVLDSDSDVVWTGFTDDSGRYEVELPADVDFPLEVVAIKDTLELRTLAPWEDDGEIVSHINPVTDLAYDWLEKRHRIDRIHTREAWLREGDSAFSWLADSLVDFEEFAVVPDFRRGHHHGFLRNLSEAVDSARESGDPEEIREIEDMARELGCHFGGLEEGEEGEDTPVFDDLPGFEWEHPEDSLIVGDDEIDSLVVPFPGGFGGEPADSIEIEDALETDSLSLP